MKLVRTKNEIIENIVKLNNYISDENDYALRLVQRGACFVVLKDNGVYKFYPSRFIGYINNNLERHIHNNDKDGKDTNPTISNILGTKPIQNELLEQEYYKYCKLLGISPYNKKHKFWDAILN
jgi:hypothetical protein